MQLSNVNTDANPEVDNQVEMESATEETNQEIREEEGSNDSQEIEENLSPADKLAKLQMNRMGNFQVTISYDDATYLRNLLEKSEYKGPQQAYLLIISKLEMSQVCETLKGMDREMRHTVEISAAAIESISFFMNSKTGKGIDSAQRLFTASMQLRPAIAQINRIEDEIEAIKNNKEAE